jgi:hypothetical protein
VKSWSDDPHRKLVVTFPPALAALIGGRRKRGRPAGRRRQGNQQDRQPSLDLLKAPPTAFLADLVVNPHDRRRQRARTDGKPKLSMSARNRGNLNAPVRQTGCA